MQPVGLLFTASALLLAAQASARSLTSDVSTAADVVDRLGRSVDESPDYQWAHPRQGWPGWYTVHQWYLDDEQRARESGQGIELIFWGDSITQCWRFGQQQQQLRMGQDGTPITLLDPGSSVAANEEALEEATTGAASSASAAANSVCAGAPIVWNKHFGSKYNAKVFGIGGDQTPELMYRLLHGEGPAGMRTRVGVLLIGTNDLGYALDKGPEAMLATAPVAASHIQSIAEYLTSYGVELVLMGVLQRGDWHQPQEVRYKQPSVFTPAVDLINARLEQYAATNPKAHYVDCSSYYLINGTEIDKRLMPDSLHPSMEGFELMAQCIEGMVQKLMGQAATSNTGYVAA